MKTLVKVLVLTLVASLYSIHPSIAQNYSCSNPPSTYQDPIWSTSNAKDFKLLASWSFVDPENCIVGMQQPGEVFGDSDFKWNWEEEFNSAPRFPTKWTITRSGEMVLVTAEFEFPIQILESSRNQNGFLQVDQRLTVNTALKLRKGDGYDISLLRGKTGLAHLWGIWLSKNQRMVPMDCKPISNVFKGEELNSSVSWKLLASGLKPKVEISIREDSNCIFLLHSGPLTSSNLPSGHNGRLFPNESLAEFPFWDEVAKSYFKDVISKPDQIVQIGLGKFTDKFDNGNNTLSLDITRVNKIPSVILNHSDTVTRESQTVKVVTTIDGTGISSKSKDVVTIYLGYYWWYSTSPSSTSSRWTVTFSGNNWTARYSRGVSVPGGSRLSYTTRAIEIPIYELFSTAEEKVLASSADSSKETIQNSSTKKTIECKKGQLRNKVTAVRPKCPKGYKVLP